MNAKAVFGIKKNQIRITRIIGKRYTTERNVSENHLEPTTPMTL